MKLTDKQRRAVHLALSDYGAAVERLVTAYRESLPKASIDRHRHLEREASEDACALIEQLMANAYAAGHDAGYRSGYSRATNDMGVTQP